ncbi:MAG: outer membrane beta-barrel protein [Bacteroidales bacterium]|nr:outer membrane beta-barrel protein [Bacteroidales bacterium]
MKKSILCALMLSVSSASFAGGLLTNTNQSLWFLRNPARDGMIGIDGVYSNPAGVMFMNKGIHLSLNWQAAFQTREINTTFPYFALGAKNAGQQTKFFKGEAKAPVIPSIQAAYNTDRWSFQFGFAVTGGGGKAEFANGLGSFESAVAGVAATLKGSMDQIAAAGIPIKTINGYDMDSYLQGRQYYFGVTLGTAYKVNEHLSIYGGLRALIGSAGYKAKIDNIQVVNNEGAKQDLLTYFGGVRQAVKGTAQQIQQGIEQAVIKYAADYMAQGMPEAQAIERAKAEPVVQGLVAKGQAVEGIATQLQGQEALLDQYANGVNLQSDQTGFGIAPIIGIDYKTGNFNFAAKYEFRTHMRLKNKSTVKEASLIEAVNKFKDGSYVEEDSPAYLTLGAMYEFLPGARLSAGYHHFYDRQSAKYGQAEKLLKGGTNEYLGGVEVDVTKKLQASAGFQITKYGLTDAFMNDMSFVCDSWSFGLGVGYKVSDKVMVNAAYFQTNYDKYKTAVVDGLSNEFYRTNKVFGVGVDFSF